MSQFDESGASGLTQLPAQTFRQDAGSLMQVVANRVHVNSVQAALRRTGGGSGRIAVDFSISADPKDMRSAAQIISSVRAKIADGANIK